LRRSNTSVTKSPSQFLGFSKRSILPPG
jgi:hypothetical protein